MKNLFVIGCYLLSLSAVAQIDYASFTGQQSSISYSKMYTYAFLYDYKVVARESDSVVVRSYGYETAEEALVRKYAPLLQQNTGDSTVNKIVLQSRLAIDVDNRRHTLIKYRVAIEGVVPPAFEVADLVLENGRWVENAAVTDELRTLMSLLKLTSVSTIYEFNNMGDNRRKPEINKLRAQAKNDAGVLDVKRLENILVQYKSILTKYQD